MEIKRAGINDISVFNAHAVHSIGAGFLQSYEWGEFKEKFGWRAERYIFVDSGDIIATAQILIHALPFGKSFAYVPQGPVIDYETEKKETVAEILKLMKKNCSKQIFLRVEPALEKETVAGKRAVVIFHEFGFKRSFEDIQPADTLILDLTKSEDELLLEMHQKCRYNIRLAEKRGVKVSQGRSAEEIEEFLSLYHETARREKLSEHDDEYMKTLIETFIASGNGKLFFARHEDKILSSIFVIHFGNTATYLYGGSSSVNRELMPNHAAQWAAIRDAKEKGFKKYDFWGIAPTDDSAHPWSGITRFKSQFGGQKISYIGAYDLPIKKAQYLAFKHAQKIRKKLIKLKKR